MSDEEIRSLLYEQEPSVLLEASSKARPKRSGMTRVFPDGHVILEGGIEESFINPNVSRVPIISGTNKDENKFFYAMNRNFEKAKEFSLDSILSSTIKTVGLFAK